MEHITKDEAINRYCSTSGIDMSTGAEYYSGYGVRRDLLGPKHLQAIYNGLTKDFGEEAGKNFCLMLEDLTDLSAANFLNQFDFFCARDLSWKGKAEKESNFAIGPDKGDGSREACAMFGLLTVMSNNSSPEEERVASEHLKQDFFRLIGYTPVKKQEDHPKGWGYLSANGG